MKRTIAAACACLFLSSSAAPAFETRQWLDLSDKDVSAQGKAALSFAPERWEHAETAHFIHHFRDAQAADTVVVNAETYYAWIKDALGVSEDAWSKKLHLFTFENKDDWQAFLKRVSPGRMEHAYAFTSGWEMYLYRDEYWLAPQQTLAHELTHVIAFRFLKGPLPLFLNEGFAEFISYRAVATKADGDEYAVRVVRLLEEADWIPLDELAAMPDYPKDAKKVATFYQESELLVRFLNLNYDRAKFRRLLLEASEGVDFQRSLEAGYGIRWREFEAKFKQFAVKHD